MKNLSRKIGVSLLGIFAFSLMSIGGCVASGVAGQIVSSKEQEAFFEHILNILQTVRSKENECGLFNASEIKAGEKYEKTDKNGGIYRRKKYDSSTDSKLVPSSFDPQDKDVILYYFNNYSGDLKMPDGGIMKLSGCLIGTNWTPGTGSMIVEGQIAFYDLSNKNATIQFNKVEINNGSDGANCGSLKSLAAKSPSPINHNTIEILYYDDTGDNCDEWTLKTDNIESNAKEKALWEKLIRFQVPNLTDKQDAG